MKQSITKKRELKNFKELQILNQKKLNQIKGSSGTVTVLDTDMEM